MHSSCSMGSHTCHIHLTQLYLFQMFFLFFFKPKNIFINFGYKYHELINNLLVKVDSEYSKIH